MAESDFPLPPLHINFSDDIPPENTGHCFFRKPFKALKKIMKTKIKLTFILIELIEIHRVGSINIIILPNLF